MAVTPNFRTPMQVRTNPGATTPDPGGADAFGTVVHNPELGLYLMWSGADWQPYAGGIVPSWIMAGSSLSVDRHVVGDLIAGSAVINGTCVTVRNHMCSGAMLATSAVVDGLSRRHLSTGAMLAASAVVAGTATRA